MVIITFLCQVAMTAVTVGFVIGKATSTRQSPIYKAVLDLDTGLLTLGCPRIPPNS